MYEERIKDHDTWNISRRAFVVEVGTQLDVLDNEYNSHIIVDRFGVWAMYYR
jgi:hypothetical protein